MVSLEGDSSTTNTTNYGTYRLVRGLAYAKLDDVAFYDGQPFVSFSMDFELVDKSGIVRYRGTLRRNWGQPTSFTQLTGNTGTQWVSVRVRIANSYMTYGNGSMCTGCPYHWKGQLTWS